MMLYIVRHAWAEERDSARWPDDGQRPLTSDGRKRFNKMLRRLVNAGIAPSVIASSPLLRCRETAELVAARVSGKPKIVLLDALAPGSDLEAALQWTARQQNNEVAWVGHSPDVEDLTGRLIGDGDCGLRFAKGAVAAIRFDGATAVGTGQLQWLATAKLLGV